MRLNQKLIEIKNETLVSFFMPGHKMGRDLEKYFQLDFGMDITEIPGADYLHDPTEVILNTEKALSERYGSKESKILVNGSTVGILSMVLGTLNRGETMLLNRNSHKSVYHAIEMGGIRPEYVLPELSETYHIVRDLKPEMVELALKENSDIKACLLTYPTYEGICYKLEEIINICHEHKVIVLVDEAHGAHLHLNKRLPKSALELGADIVIQSFHKTLPSLTQTACLHFGKNHRLTEAQVQNVKWHLSALQTSSPSYLLMGSIDGMLSLLEDVGNAKMKGLLDAIEVFEENISNLKDIKCIRFEQMDMTKLILAPSVNIDLSGHQLSEILRESYHIQVEYATKELCLLMPSISNAKDDFLKLFDALFDIEKKYCPPKREQILNQNSSEVISEITETDEAHYPKMMKPQVAVIPAEAKLLEGLYCPIEQCQGHVSKQYLIPYPPGIPILVPGEIITKTKCMEIQSVKQNILNFRDEKIFIVNKNKEVL